jgi:DNA-binding MarR family transcriptional regulator
VTPPLDTDEHLGASGGSAAPADEQRDHPTLGADLLAVVARINRMATQRVRMPLPYAQGRLLSTIEDQGEARISDLAALDHCSQPTMTTQVRRLEDAGLVSRTVDPGDGRAVLIRITPKGVQTLRQVRADRGSAVDPYLERLDDADRATLADAVHVMRRLLDDAAPQKPAQR